MNIKSVSLSEVIKKKISKPVFKHVIFSLFCIVMLSIYILVSSLDQLESRIKKIVEPIADFIIKEELANNTDAVKIKIEDFNQDNSPFKIEWVSNGEPKNKNVQLHDLFFWTYDYHIASVSDYHFGYLQVSGNIFSDKKTMTLLFCILLCLLVITGSSIVNLLPLITKIPEELFIKPINNFIDLISKNPNAIEISHQNPGFEKNLPSELEMLESKIFDLLRTAKEHERNEVAIKISHLSARLIHDTRSTLSAIEMSLESLMNKSNPVIFSSLTNGLNSIQNVRDTFNNYLTHYRNAFSENFSIELLENLDNDNVVHPVLLSSLVEYIVNQKKLEWCKNPCELFISVSPNSKFCWINAAPTQIKRLLSNLLNNSYEAISDKANGSINLCVSRENENIILSIIDNGIGIPKEKINDVLNGLSLKHSGKGLGLSEAKKYMDGINGGLELLFNTNQKGVTVRLNFPVESSTSWISKEISILNASTVIVLDDNFSMLSYWEQRISEHGIPVKLFHDYNKALKWVQGNKDIVSSCTFIADFHLSEDKEINGLAFLSSIKNNNQRYLITTHAEELDLQKSVADSGNIWLIPKSLANEVILI